MSTFHDLMREARGHISEVLPSQAAAQMEDAVTSPILLDVRDGDELEQGMISGALHIPRGSLELRIEQAVPNQGHPILVYCAGGVRSLLAGETLRRMGYHHVSSLAGGFSAWRAAGLPFMTPSRLTPAQRERYSRHLLLPEVGDKGQQALLAARVLLVGAGGLGAPIALYLAAAGVGTLGIVDADLVDVSNLQRQVIHTTAHAGQPKVESARRAIQDLNPDVRVIPVAQRVSKDNILSLVADYDILVDGTDNFETRYVLSDASVYTGKPLVFGSVFRFDGQVSTFVPGRGPCYRCLFPLAPPPELAPNCADIGVLGVLPGLIGLLQATEVLKLILGIGDPLIGRLLLYDALGACVTDVRVPPDPACPACGTAARLDPADLGQIYAAHPDQAHA